MSCAKLAGKHDFITSFAVRQNIGRTAGTVNALTPVCTVRRHTVTKIVTPEENQKSDGWLFFYRSYGIADTLENKVNGIYVHTAA
ncbi:MAG: hypothetical protein ACTTKL_07555 [Treponema sp.]